MHCPLRSNSVSGCAGEACPSVATCSHRVGMRRSLPRVHIRCGCASANSGVTYTLSRRHNNPIGFYRRCNLQNQITVIFRYRFGWHHRRLAFHSNPQYNRISDQIPVIRYDFETASLIISKMTSGHSGLTILWKHKKIHLEFSTQTSWDSCFQKENKIRAEKIKRQRG